MLGDGRLYLALFSRWDDVSLTISQVVDTHAGIKVPPTCVLHDFLLEHLSDHLPSLALKNTCVA